MSDNEIIKNLKYCCLIDPKTIFIRNDRTGEITTLNMNDVLNLINRLQVEIEVCNEALDNSMKLNNRLQAQNKNLVETVHNLTLEKDALFDNAEELKAEIERLKE